MSNIIIHGVKKNSSQESLEKIISDVFLAATDNLSWLKAGETVLLKPALNSPDPYPATTHPLSISVIAKLLKQHGAKVIIADQSGIEHVVHSKNGVIKGSSKNNYIKSGMSQFCDQNFLGLESLGWDAGFHHFQNDQTTAWKDGFYISNIIDQVDHIINLPRLSTHGQAGVSLGFKNLVGLLREDSRIEFHANGPYFDFIKNYSRGGEFDYTDDKKDAFFEKIVQIYLAVHDKMRLTLFTATKAFVTFGPDKNIVPVLGSYEVEPETGLVFASNNPLAADLFALSFLTTLYKKTPFIDKSLQKILMFFNHQAKELGSQSVWDNRFIKEALRLELGNEDFTLEYNEVADELQLEIKKILKK